MAQKKGETDNRKCWENGSIFQSIKVILEISLTPPTGPPVIDISYTQPSFTNTFGYPDEAFPMSLERLISDANKDQDVNTLLRAILTGSSHNTFITLQDYKGIHLACNVQVSVGSKVDNRFSRSSSEPPHSTGPGILRNHITTLTIRSASMVGNTKALHVLVDAAQLGSSESVRERTMQRVNERIAENITVHSENTTAKMSATATKQPASLKFQSKSSTNTKTRAPPAPPPCTALATGPTAADNTVNQGNEEWVNLPVTKMPAYGGSNGNSGGDRLMDTFSRSELSEDMYDSVYVRPPTQYATDSATESRKSDDSAGHTTNTDSTIDINNTDTVTNSTDANIDT